MSKYPNRLEVQIYQPFMKKLDQSDKKLHRARSSTQDDKQFTNLYIEKLPWSYDEATLLSLFSIYGEVVSIKMKKPISNVRFNNLNYLPFSAYVNYASQKQAEDAMEALNGKQLLPDTKSIRIEFYQRSSRYLCGSHKGIDKNQLINNEHYRVLFIKGLDTQVTKNGLHEICKKYGGVD